MCFLPLAQALDADVNVVGLQPRGLDGIYVPHLTIEAAAQYYAESIRKYQTSQITLVGHSFGGWVAFEVACALKSTGENVDSVLLLDSMNPTASFAGARFDALQDVLELVGILEQSSCMRFAIEEAQLESMNETQRLKVLLEQMLQAGLATRTTTIQFVAGLVRTFSVNRNTRYYPSRVFDGEITLVTAQEHSAAVRSRGRRRESLVDITEWRRFAPRLGLATVSGNHMSMLKLPNAHAIARLIQKP
jgi:arthrofactin-type cyclic lipopeptide synthetase C